MTTVLLVGLASHGKSSLGNSILGLIPREQRLDECIEIENKTKLVHDFVTHLEKIILKKLLEQSDISLEFTKEKEMFQIFFENLRKKVKTHDEPFEVRAPSAIGTLKIEMKRNEEFVVVDTSGIGDTGTDMAGSIADVILKARRVFKLTEFSYKNRTDLKHMAKIANTCDQMEGITDQTNVSTGEVKENVNGEQDGTAGNGKENVTGEQDGTAGEVKENVTGEQDGTAGEVKENVTGEQDGTVGEVKENVTGEQDGIAGEGMGNDNGEQDGTACEGTENVNAKQDGIAGDRKENVNGEQDDTAGERKVNVTGKQDGIVCEGKENVTGEQDGTAGEGTENVNAKQDGIAGDRKENRNGEQDGTVAEVKENVTGEQDGIVCEGKENVTGEQDGTAVEGEENIAVVEISATDANEEPTHLKDHGFDAILFVLKFGVRFTKQLKDAVGMIKYLYGENVFKDWGILVFTNGDNFDKESGQNFSEWCKDQKGEIKHLFEEVQYRCVIFDNKTENSEIQSLQRSTLSTMINKVKEQKRQKYTIELFAAPLQNLAKSERYSESNEEKQECDDLEGQIHKHLRYCSHSMSTTEYKYLLGILLETLINGKKPKETCILI